MDKPHCTHTPPHVVRCGVVGCGYAERVGDCVLCCEIGRVTLLAHMERAHGAATSVTLFAADRAPCFGTPV